MRKRTAKVNYLNNLAPVGGALGAMVNLSELEAESYKDALFASANSSRHVPTIILQTAALHFSYFRFNDVQIANQCMFAVEA
jgi:hypothetical protein